MTANKALSQQADASFDILWFDPPYAQLSEQWPLLVPQLSRIAAEDAVIVVESDHAGAEFLKTWSAAEEIRWDLSKQKTYGSIAVSFFERSGE